jgi:hypothetical protein
MSANWKKGIPLALVAGLVIALAVMVCFQPARAQREGTPASGPHYTVVETEGHNLIVTDNQKEMLYFYTIDKGKEVGTELKLRGQLDLKQVGKPVIKPENVHRAE